MNGILRQIIAGIVIALIAAFVGSALSRRTVAVDVATLTGRIDSMEQNLARRLSRIETDGAPIVRQMIAQLGEQINQASNDRYRGAEAKRDFGHINYRLNNLERRLDNMTEPK